MPLKESLSFPSVNLKRSEKYIHLLNSLLGEQSFSPDILFLIFQRVLISGCALTRRTFVGKVMSLLLNMLSRLVITFLPRSKCLLISWLLPDIKCPEFNKHLQAVPQGSNNKNSLKTQSKDFDNTQM